MKRTTVFSFASHVSSKHRSYKLHGQDFMYVYKALSGFLLQFFALKIESQEPIYQYH
jgi:hypothetical protein